MCISRFISKYRIKVCTLWYAYFYFFTLYICNCIFRVIRRRSPSQKYFSIRNIYFYIIICRQSRSAFTYNEILTIMCCYFNIICYIIILTFTICIILEWMLVRIPYYIVNTIIIKLLIMSRDICWCISCLSPTSKCKSII